MGCIFVLFAIAGIWIPGWPTVSWAVPAAFLFSLSNERLFRWSLTNRYFGKSMFDYYATGKTLPDHVKYIIAFSIFFMSGNESSSTSPTSGNMVDCLPLVSTYGISWQLVGTFSKK